MMIKYNKHTLFDLFYIVCLVSYFLNELYQYKTNKILVKGFLLFKFMITYRSFAIKACLYKQ